MVFVSAWDWFDSVVCLFGLILGLFVTAYWFPACCVAFLDVLS